MPFLVGMPSAEVGPVSGMLTPIVMSACAGAAASAAKLGRSGGASDADSSSCACLLMVGDGKSRHSQSARMSSGTGIARSRSGSSASRRTKARVSRPSQISVSPRVTRWCWMNTLARHSSTWVAMVELLGVGRGLDEPGRDLEQRRADDAARLDQLAPRRHAALHEERQRRRVHPAREVRIENDARRIAVAELDRHAVVAWCAAWRSRSGQRAAGSRRARCRRRGDRRRRRGASARRAG